MNTKKRCGKCNKLKHLSEFHKNTLKKDGVQSMCKDCRKIYHRYHYLKNKKKYLNNSKKHKLITIDKCKKLKQNLLCEICGENRYWVLDFHHIDPSKKDFNIGSAIRVKSFKKLVEEMKKCRVLCANCHRDFHFKSKAS